MSLDALVTAIFDLQRQVDYIFAQRATVASLPLSPPMSMWPPLTPRAPIAWPPAPPVWSPLSPPVCPPPCAPKWQPTVALAPGDWLPPSSIEEKATAVVEAVDVASELAAPSPSSVPAPVVEAQQIDTVAAVVEAQQIDSAATPSKLEEQAETTTTAATTPALAVPSSPSAPTHRRCGLPTRGCSTARRRDARQPPWPRLGRSPRGRLRGPLLGTHPQLLLAGRRPPRGRLREPPLGCARHGPPTLFYAAGSRLATPPLSGTAVHRRRPPRGRLRPLPHRHAARHRCRPPRPLRAGMRERLPRGRFRREPWRVPPIQSVLSASCFSLAAGEFSLRPTATMPPFPVWCAPMPAAATATSVGQRAVRSQLMAMRWVVECFVGLHCCLYGGLFGGMLFFSGRCSSRETHFEQLRGIQVEVRTKAVVQVKESRK
jgi:hypothetical protein